MATVEHGELQVVVPVGFLLAEAQEVTVSVNRPGEEPLPVRLRLIPARPCEEEIGVATLEDVAEEDFATVGARAARQSRWPKRPMDDVERYWEPEYGGSD